MPTIEVTEDQREYIEDLRAELEETHVGAYGTVRTQDAVQFLIDHHDAGVTMDGGDATTRSQESGAGSGDGTAVESDDGTERSPGGDDGASGGDGDGGPGRLNAMMQLIEKHDDKWEEVESDQGKYAVSLPDGDTEHVRTKDDIRALLFRHYD